MSSLSNDQDYQALRQDDSEVEQQLSRQRHQESELSLKEKEFSSDDEGMMSKSKEISTWRVAMNMVNYMEGFGFLALPYAIHEGGITALIGLAVAPIVMAYSAYLLAECLDEEDDFGERKRVRWTYQDIGMACWPPFEHIVWVFVSLILYISTCSLIILCSSLMSQQFPHVAITEAQWACLGTALVFPMVFFTKLSGLVWISLIGVVALVASAGIALGYEFQEISNWNFQSLFFWDTRGAFVSLSIVIISYGIHDGSVKMAAEVSSLSKFKVALTWSYLFTATFKIIFAVSGFLTYTIGTSEVLLNNLPRGILLKVIATLFVLNVLLSYPLFILVLLNNIEGLAIYEQLTTKIPPWICFVMLRILVVLAVLAFSVGVPHFALVSAFNGSCYNCIALIFPGVFHLCLKYKQLSKLQVVVDVSLIILGIIGACFGLVTTIMSFVAKI